MNNRLTNSVTILQLRYISKLHNVHNVQKVHANSNATADESG